VLGVVGEGAVGVGQAERPRPIDAHHNAHRMQGVEDVPVERRHRPAHVMLRVEDEESVLQLADVLVRAVDLDHVREAGEKTEEARALAQDVIGLVHHHIDTPRAARAEEPFEERDARRVVQAQRRSIGIEDAQLASGLAEQPLDRRLEAGARIESLVGRFVLHRFSIEA
jgi:hypothetical protein